MTTKQRLKLLRELRHEINELVQIAKHEMANERVGIGLPMCVSEEAAQREERAVELFCTAFEVELRDVVVKDVVSA